ncbi:MAG: hypothetical protein AABZ11_05845 [Nitrospinota bacterium]
MANLHKMMEIRFAGKDIFPKTIRAKELADILANIEKSLADYPKRKSKSFSRGDYYWTCKY